MDSFEEPAAIVEEDEDSSDESMYSTDLGHLPSEFASRPLKDMLGGWAMRCYKTGPKVETPFSVSKRLLHSRRRATLFPFTTEVEGADGWLPFEPVQDDATLLSVAKTLADPKVCRKVAVDAAADCPRRDPDRLSIFRSPTPSANLVTGQARARGGCERAHLQHCVPVGGAGDAARQQGRMRCPLGSDAGRGRPEQPAACALRARRPGGEGGVSPHSRQGGGYCSCCTPFALHSSLLP